MYDYKTYVNQLKGLFASALVNGFSLFAGFLWSFEKSCFLFCIFKALKMSLICQN